VLPRFNALNAILIAAIAVALLIGFTQRAPSRGLEIVRGTPPAGVDTILVQVSGAVLAPGLVEADSGERVAEVIARAGGLASDADVAGVNLARRVRDEDEIHVPRLGEAAPLLDLNRASADELEALPGIGPVYAGRIVDARDATPFASSDDLLDRELIPARTYEQIRDLVSVGVP